MEKEKPQKSLRANEEFIPLENAQRANYISFLGTLVLVILKFIAAHYTQSIAILGDAYNSLGDFFATFISYIGLRFASKPATSKFKFGFYKAENLATLLISSFIVYVGITTIISGASTIKDPGEIFYYAFALISSVVSIIISLIMSIYMRKIGEEANSQSLIAAGTERRGDVFLSSLVFIAIFTRKYNISWLEGLIAIFIGIWLIITALGFIKESIFVLLDISPNKELEKEIKKILKENPKVKKIRDLRLRKSGPVIFGEVKAEIPKTLDLARTHEILDQIEDIIKEKHPKVVSFLIHPEPVEIEYNRILVPVKDHTRGLAAEISEHFGRAPGFLIVELGKDTGFEVVDSFPNTYEDKKVRAGLVLGKFLIEKKEFDVFLTSSIGEITFNFFREHVKDMYKIEEGITAEKAVKRFAKNELSPIKTYTTRKEEI